MATPDKPAKPGRPEPSRSKVKAPLWEQLVELGRSIPKEEWDRLPPDFSENLDHYVYGTPKSQK